VIEIVRGWLRRPFRALVGILTAAKPHHRLVAIGPRTSIEKDDTGTSGGQSGSGSCGRHAGADKDNIIVAHDPTSGVASLSISSAQYPNPLHRVGCAEYDTVLQTGRSKRISARFSTGWS